MELQEKSTQLVNFVYKEKINLTILNACINYAEENKEDSDYYRRMMNCFYKIRNNTKEGFLDVSYSRKYKFGRIYPVGNLSLGKIYRPYRHTLCKDYYYDIDIQNAHPTILNHLCNLLDINHDQLQDYVNNRQKILDSIMSHYSISKDIAKNLIIRLLNNGSYTSWKKENNLGKIMDLPFIIKIQKEFKNITTQLIELNENLYEDCVLKTKKEIEEGNKYFENSRGCFMSYYLGESELRILETMVLFIKEKYNTDEIILCHDGIMIPKHLIKSKELKNLLIELQNNIIEKMSMDNILLTIKEMDEAIQLNIPEEKLNANKIAKENCKEVEEFKFLLQNFNNEQILAKHFSEKKKYFIYYRDQWYYANTNNVWVNSNKKCPLLLSTISEYYLKKINKFSYLIDAEEDNKQRNELEKQFKIFRTFVGSSIKVSGIIKYLEDYYERLDEDLFDSNQYIFALNDKVIDFSNSNDIKIRDIELDDYITITTGYNYEEPDNKIIKTLEETINKIQPNKEERDYLLSILARSLIAKSPEKFYFLLGNGGNGKSLLITTFMKAVMGKYYSILNKGVLTKPMTTGACPELANLRGKRNVAISELEKNETFNIGVMNTLTGGEGISARGLYDSAVETVCNFSMFILTNFKPKFNGAVQDNLVRRMVAIPFNSRFTDKEEDVDEECNIYLANDKLKDIEYIKEIRIHLLHILIKNFKMNPIVPKSIKQYTDDYLKTSSGDFVSWFNENYEQTYKGALSPEKMKQLVLDENYISISEAFNLFKQSDEYKNLDKNEKKLNDLKNCIDCLTKSLYTKYYSDVYQYRLNGSMKKLRNILVGFKVIREEKEEEQCMIEKEL